MTIMRNFIPGMIYILFMIQLLTQNTVAIGQLPNNSCVDCHGKLLFSSESKQFVDMRIKHIENGISCSIDCHEDKANRSIASSYALWKISAHAQFNVTCEKCHGGNPLADSKIDAHTNLSNDSIARENTPDTCGKCHVSQLEEFKNSTHFKRLESGEVPAPACITCHQAHTVHVLTTSELEDFCSNCHNNITGIDPTVPKRAEDALTSVAQLRQNYSKAHIDIIDQKVTGKNVTEAEAELDSTNIIIKNIPSLWHRFNLTNFDAEVQQGFIHTQNAENLLAGKPLSTVPKTSGFEGIIGIIAGIFVFVYLMRKN